MKQSIYNIKFQTPVTKPLDITLTGPLWITENPLVAKEEMKRVILEIVDSFPKTFVAYSGGLDSAFILCVIRDLIEEGKLKKDTIEIVQGIFTVYDHDLTMDAVRATKFATSLGFNPRIYRLDMNETWDEAKQYCLDSHLVGPASFDLALEMIWLSRQDGMAITGTIIGRNNRYDWRGDPKSAKRNEVIPNGRFVQDMCLRAHYYKWDSNNWLIPEVWDNKIYSSFILPFTFKRRKINLKDLNKPLSEDMEYAVRRISWDQGFERIIQHLQIYPELCEVFFKFGSKDWLTWRLINEEKNDLKVKEREAYRIEREFKTPMEYSPVKNTKGELYILSDMLNAKDYADDIERLQSDEDFLTHTTHRR